MKQILFTIFMTLVGLNAPAIAKEVSAINGSSHLTKGEYDSLKVNGHLLTDLLSKICLLLMEAFMVKT